MPKRPASSQELLGDAPIESQHRDNLNKLARVIDEILNNSVKGSARKIGFCMMVFEFGSEGRCNYISNARRDDVVVLLKEQLARFESQSFQERKA